MHRPYLRLAIFTSWRSEGLEGLLPAEGRWEVVAGVVTELGSSAARFFDRHRVPWVLRDLRGFCLRKGVPLSDLDARRAFDAQTAAWLKPFRPDLLVLCGYRYRLCEPVLSSWPNRIINVHDADLRLRTPQGGPRYPGLRAVRDAILAGEAEIRSTVHLVTPEVDAGPPLVVSGPYPVCLREEVQAVQDGLGTYIAVHRERMIRDCWGPLLRSAVELFCNDGVQLLPEGRLLIDGHPAPFVISRGTAHLAVWEEVA